MKVPDAIARLGCQDSASEQVFRSLAFPEASKGQWQAIPAADIERLLGKLLSAGHFDLAPFIEPMRSPS